jgi:hypothetical protein
MVNWMSQAEIVKDAAAFDRLIHCLLGLYMYVLCSLSTSGCLNAAIQVGVGSVPGL